MLKIGKLAPDFELLNQDGKPVRLSSFRGQRVVIFFFPKANEFSAGCIAQACSFRNEFDEIKAEKAVVLGISHDSVAELNAWRKNHRLQYDLLSDPGFKVHEEWGTKMSLFGTVTLPFTNRSYFVIETDGTIADMQVGVNPMNNARKALEALRRLNAAAV